MSIASNLKLAETLTQKTEPFIQELRKKEKFKSSVTEILELIKKLEISDGIEAVVIGLYNLLQNQEFDEIVKNKPEATESLNYLYDLMLKIYNILVTEGFPSSAHIVSHLITEVVLSEYSS